MTVLGGNNMEKSKATWKFTSLTVAEDGNVCKSITFNFFPDADDLKQVCRWNFEGKEEIAPSTTMSYKLCIKIQSSRF